MGGVYADIRQVCTHQADGSRRPVSLPVEGLQGPTAGCDFLDEPGKIRLFVGA